MATAATAKALESAYDSPQELELVHRAKGGDDAAFATLYNHHFARVKAAIRRMVADDIADWLANATMTKVWENLRGWTVKDGKRVATAGFNEQSKFSTWITRIAINEALMHLRGERARSRAGTLSLEAVLEAGHKDDPDPPLPGQKWIAVRDLGLAGVADRDVLKRAIERVPAPYREALKMRYWDEMTLDEMQRMVGCRRSALKTRLSRGRKMLMEQVENFS
jgi:RNA polymerase sigma-70 factor (ECF subfamily)